MYLLLYFRGMVGVVLLTVEQLHLRVQQLLLNLDKKQIRNRLSDRILFSLKSVDYQIQHPANMIYNPYLQINKNSHTDHFNF